MSSSSPDQQDQRQNDIPRMTLLDPSSKNIFFKKKYSLEKKK